MHCPINFKDPLVKTPIQYTMYCSLFMLFINGNFSYEIVSKDYDKVLFVISDLINNECELINQWEWSMKTIDQSQASILTPEQALMVTMCNVIIVIIWYHDTQHHKPSDQALSVFSSKRKDISLEQYLSNIVIKDPE